MAGNLLKEIARGWFVLTLASSIFVGGIFTHSLSLIRSCGLIGDTVQFDLSSCFVTLAFRFALFLNPQIKITIDGEWNEMMKDKPAMVIMNHSSFFDFFVISSILPLGFIKGSHPRTVMSEALTHIPFFGKMIGAHCGSFKVYFKAEGSGFGKGNASDYSVDKSKQASENERMDKHLDNGGVVAFCPEGGMNKKPLEGLLPFRRGSFVQAVKYRTPIYGLSMVGCTTCWPRFAQIGGYPAHIHIKIHKIMIPSLNQEAMEVAEFCQNTMEKQVNDLRAKVSQDKKEK